MGVILPPLEFTECLSDSPYFRENLHKHESELEKTNQQIKRIIKEVKDLLAAAKQLGNAQRSFAGCLRSFTFECIGETQTDDEQTICSALKNFSELIIQVEEERNRMLENANASVLKPLEEFRKKYIGGVKNEKKKFEKQTAKFCQNQERYLNKTNKNNPNTLQEADASVDMAERHFYAASMHYVYLIQEVHERKKFEFVETLLTFVYAWFTFYHQGHELKKDFDPFMRDLQQKIQKTRSNFDDFSEKLKKRMSEVQKLEAEPVKKGCKEGYLFLLEKKAFGTAWTKHYCTYDKDRKEFTMLPYNQLTTKTLPTLEKMTISQCIRRKSDSIEKRFCFDIQAIDKPGVVYTFQALSEQDRTSWMDIMDGKEPTYTTPSTKMISTQNEDCYVLDDVGLSFVKKCIEILEKRGLEEQGIYRVVGVTSKVNKLLVMGLDRRKNEKLNLEDPQEWESKTITSALKTYLRSLPEPLMTYKYHNDFIGSVKKESRQQRIYEVHKLLYKIPKTNFEVLKILVKHLTNVVKKCDKNLMTVSNLGVCFGPTLLRPEEETVASIMDLKFYNIVVEILIENYEKIFLSEPETKFSNGATSNNLVYNHLPPNNHLPTYSPENDIYGSNNRTVYAQPIRVSPNYRPQPAYNQPPPYTCAVNSYIETSIPPSMYTNHDSNNDNSIYGVSRSEQRPNSRTRFKHYVHEQRDSSVTSPPNQSYSPTFRSYTQLESNSTSSSNDSLSSASRDGNIASLANNPKKTERTLHMGYPQVYKSPGNVRVRTLYACLGEHEGELSFEPNQIITNVKSSAEPGWLEGTLNGKSGLIPENYVEILP